MIRSESRDHGAANWRENMTGATGGERRGSRAPTVRELLHANVIDDDYPNPMKGAAGEEFRRAEGDES